MTIVKTSIISLIAIALFKDNFKSVNINPPNQFILATSSEALQKYLDAKKDNASNHILNKLYIDYLNSEYEQNPVQFERQKMIMLLNPEPHKDLNEVNGLLNENEIFIKKNLTELIYMYENSGKILAENKLQDIKKEFLTYKKEYENIST